MDWLVNAGGIADHRITHSDNKGWLAFDATTEEAENLLHTEFHEFEYSSSGNSKVACDQYHVPKSVQPHIDYITPGIKGARTSSGRLSKRGFSKGTGKPGQPFTWVPPKQKPAPFIPQNSTELATCDVAITPACIRALYNIPLQDPHAKVCANNSMGIFEDGDFYSQQDLNLFFANFTPYIPAGTHPIPNFVDGAQAPVPVADAGGESDLDFQLAYPIIYPQTTTLYQTDDIFYSTSPNNTATGILNTFLDALDGVCTNLPFLLTCANMQSSLTAHTLRTERKETTPTWTLFIPTPTQVATRESFSAESTSQQTSSRSRTVSRSKICQPTTKSVNATSES